MEPCDRCSERVRRTSDSLQRAANTDMLLFRKEKSFSAIDPSNSTLPDIHDSAIPSTALGSPFRFSSCNTYQASSTKSRLRASYNHTHHIHSSLNGPGDSFHYGPSSKKPIPSPADWLSRTPDSEPLRPPTLAYRNPTALRYRASSPIVPMGPFEDPATSHPCTVFSRSRSPAVDREFQPRLETPRDRMDEVSYGGRPDPGPT